MDLSQYSTEQLKNLLDTIPAELKRREKETRVKLRQEFEELAKKHGFSLDELLSESKPAKGSVAPKYRHPNDASLTWTGRGRKPLWVSSLLDAGNTLESLLIK